MSANGILALALRTLETNEDNEDVNIEEGEKPEFLRGTFSVMQFDENSIHLLNDLKAKFMNFRKEIGGLDQNEFEKALRPVLPKSVSHDHIVRMFKQIDTRDIQAVNWNEFLNFAIEEHNKRLRLRETMDEMPLSPDVKIVPSQHKEPITRITLMPFVDPNSKVINWGAGKYHILARDGTMSLWTSRMKFVSFNQLGSGQRHDPAWYLDLAAMYHNGFIAVATTARDIIFYDYTRRGWCRKYWLTKLPHCVTCMYYWAGLVKKQQAILLWGDTNGNVNMLDFDLSERTPLFGITVQEGCHDVRFPDVMKGLHHGVVARVFPNLHKDWVKEVKYAPEVTSFLSCCSDGSTAMYMSYIEPKKKRPTYFNTLKGMLCFDFSHSLNILACGGIDCHVWLFNPYVPHKAVGMIEGHIRPVVHMTINETENYLISNDLSKTIIMFSLRTQAVIQRIPGQSVRMGNYPINTVYFNFVTRFYIMGAVRLGMLKRARLEGLGVDIRSHDHKLVGASYSDELNQIVSADKGSVVRVWDVITGTRVMQFEMAHKRKVQGRWIPVEIECIALGEQKRRLFTAAEGVIKIWNFSVGLVLRVLDMKECQRVTSIVMAKSQIYVTGWHKCIDVFSDFPGEEEIKKTWTSRHIQDCLSLCIMEPNLIASSSYDGCIIVWSRETNMRYCTMNACWNVLPELDNSVKSGGAGADIIQASENRGSDDEESEEDAFMTIGRHLKKTGGWYRGLRALKKRQIEREKRRLAKEKRDISSMYKKKKKKMNIQAVSLIFESAVECMVYLQTRRLVDPHTAILVTAGAECWIRFWSVHPNGGLLAQFNSARRKLESVLSMTTDKKNEYLFTGDTMGLLRIWDIKEFCNGEKLTHDQREEREKRLKQEFIYHRLPFGPEKVLDTMERLREIRMSVPDSSKPRKNLKSPRLLSSIRAHNRSIVSVEFLDDRNIILTASHDFTVRLWTKSCTYIGTFGEIWNPLPKVVGTIVEKNPRIPRDIQRTASARSLATLHNGRMPHWNSASKIVRRHIAERAKEKLIEETRQKRKDERRARGEPDSDEETDAGNKPVSKILGKYYVGLERYKGPITIEDQGYPPLRKFMGKVSPYNTTIIRELQFMDPLYKPNTFFDIDKRRSHKSRRQVKHMMNDFNMICGDPQRFTGQSKATSGSPTTSPSTALSAISGSETFRSGSPKDDSSEHDHSNRVDRRGDKTQNKNFDIILDGLRDKNLSDNKSTDLSHQVENEYGYSILPASSETNNNLFSYLNSTEFEYPTESARSRKGVTFDDNFEILNDSNLLDSSLQNKYSIEALRNSCSFEEMINKAVPSNFRSNIKSETSFARLPDIKSKELNVSSSKRSRIEKWRDMNSNYEFQKVRSSHLDRYSSGNPRTKTIDSKNVSARVDTWNQQYIDFKKRKNQKDEFEDWFDDQSVNRQTTSKYFSDKTGERLSSLSISDIEQDDEDDDVLKLPPLPPGYVLSQEGKDYLSKSSYQYV